ncbi:MAG: SAM-dependent methyltransferase [Chloroflexi bacterium]|nr:SAM-dependent methyltransferase [Chloroflexota bacterium]
MDAVLRSVEQALHARSECIDPGHEGAFRLFNGFSEGFPGLVVDVYGRTLVLQDRTNGPRIHQTLIEEIAGLIRHELGWLRAGIVKFRKSSLRSEILGVLIFGDQIDRRIQEHGIWHALDLRLNQDASFYLDTRTLRKWVQVTMSGRSMLNTFAYTGSLGTAALSGGASRVVQLERNRRFLNLAKESYRLNGFPVQPEDFLACDFFPAAAEFRRCKQAFDCVILDPPFFSSTAGGRVDLIREYARLINKVRPLVKDGGHLIAINNALYVSGNEYIQTLDKLGGEGFMEIKDLIPIPEDCIGYHCIGTPPTDPSPFNHSTKIAILEIRQK